nr:S-adenosylmethionine:tRNA ribosyltransferase-isomerase [Clostridia bacterium]
MIKNTLTPTSLTKSDFFYDLPERLIAQTPVEPRDSSRLMVVDRESGNISHHIFRDIIDYLYDGDVLVINDSKVIPARLFGKKADTGVEIEVLLLRQREVDVWEVILRPG